MTELIETQAQYQEVLRLFGAVWGQVGAGIRPAACS
ncbi:hypothetical protein ACVWZX_001209 [Deinococcus sp. UYEF24]